MKSRNVLIGILVLAALLTFAVVDTAHQIQQNFPDRDAQIEAAVEEAS